MENLTEEILDISSILLRQAVYPLLFQAVYLSKRFTSKYFTVIRQIQLDLWGQFDFIHDRRISVNKHCLIAQDSNRLDNNPVRSIPSLITNLVNITEVLTKIDYHLRLMVIDLYVAFSRLYGIIDFNRIGI